MRPAVLKNGYLFGVACGIGGGLCLSFGGILLRHIEQADGWQILFYRSVTFFITLTAILAVRYRSKTLSAFRAVGRRGVVVAVSLGLGSVCYIFAILNTTVANAVFIVGASPLVAAAVGWLFLRERVLPLSIVAMVVALGGIALMFVDGFIAGRWLGNVMAAGVVAGFVVMLVALRGAKDTDMLPATCMAGLVSASLSAVMVADLDINAHDLVITLLLGSVQYGAGFMLITVATRHLQAAEVALFTLSEAVFAPIWVWIGVGETPSHMTLTGSGIVLLAVVAHCIITIRRNQEQPPIPT
jgi:DME family drug/metabolite transporter